jgi:hypothetical protein
VAGRASVFSDPRVLAAARDFLPAADVVWRLQRGGDAECLFFQRAVNGGEPITDNGTRQGIYVMSPSGRVLARVNSLDADRVLTMMADGLAAWKELPAAERRLDPAALLDGEERWEGSRPEKGLILERLVRDLPPVGGPQGERAAKWNRDSLWFSQAEAKELVAAAQAASGLAPADDEGWRAAPESFTRRLASFTLVDNVYGQCIPFDAGDLEEVVVEVRATIQDGTMLALQLRGRTMAREDGAWTLGDNLWTPRNLHDHAMQTVLLGDALWDVQDETFQAFEMVALGRRSGFTELNSRRFRPEPGGIGFLIRLDRRAWSPAPTFMALYEADWVRKPKLGRELRLR